MNKRILLSISSKTSSRFPLILLKDYFQQNAPEITLDYLISQHDDPNKERARSGVLESTSIDSTTDLIIGLDGYLKKGMYEGVRAPRILLHTLDTGAPSNAEAYISGYSCLITENDRWADYFKDACARKQVRLISGVASPLREALTNRSRIDNARQQLTDRYPQLSGKRLLVLTVRNDCLKQYADTLSSMDLKKLYRLLPEDTAFAANCAQLFRAFDGLPAHYADKIVNIRHRDLLNAICAADWNISNVSAAGYASAPLKVIAYAENDFENYASRFRPESLIVPGTDMPEEMLRFIQTPAAAPDARAEGQNPGTSFMDILKTL